MSYNSKILQFCVTRTVVGLESYNSKPLAFIGHLSNAFRKLIRHQQENYTVGSATVAEAVTEE